MTSITAEKLANILLQHPKARVYVQSVDSTFGREKKAIENHVYDNNCPYGKGIHYEKNEKSNREQIILNFFE